MPFQQRRLGFHPRGTTGNADGPLARFFVPEGKPDPMTDLVAKTSIDQRLAAITRPVIEGMGFELVRLISNWTKVLTLYTHGRSTLTKEQVAALSAHQIAIVEGEVAELSHEHGQLHGIRFKDGSAHSLHALYAMPAFEQHCPIPQELGCAMTEDGYIQVDGLQRTSVPGIYACGDSTARLRTVANAVSAGTTAGMMLNKELVVEEF